MHCLFCDQIIQQPSSFTQFLLGIPSTYCCKRCEEQIEYTSDSHAIYFYNSFMQDVLHQFKFLKDIRVADFFAKALKKKVRGMEYDLIIPIPMHVEMEKKRTFSPVEVVLQQAKLPFQSVLEKTTMSQQSKKTYEQRINSSSFFKSLPQVDVTQQKILLIDDLITTGTTIKHAKTILLELGAKSVEEVIFISGKK